MKRVQFDLNGGEELLVQALKNEYGIKDTKHLFMSLLRKDIDRINKTRESSSDESQEKIRQAS